jgi:site-specific DNA recombinase
MNEQQRIAIYIRLSKDRKGSLSLVDQEARCRAFATAQGWAVVAVYSETASGASTNGRHEFLKMEADMRAKPRKFDAVLVLRIDRLGRSMLDLVTFAYEARKHGVRIATVEGSLDSGTAVGQLVFNVLASVATMERELISARTRDNLERRKLNGLRWSGRVLFGLRPSTDGQHVELDPSRVPVLWKICTMRDRRFSYATIAEALDRAGENDPTFQPAASERWSKMSVRGVVLERQTYLKFGAKL